MPSWLFGLSPMPSSFLNQVQASAANLRIGWATSHNPVGDLLDKVPPFLAILPAALRAQASSGVNYADT